MMMFMGTDCLQLVYENAEASVCLDLTPRRVKDYEYSNSADELVMIPVQGY